MKPLYSSSMDWDSVLVLGLVLVMVLVLVPVDVAVAVVDKEKDDKVDMVDGSHVVVVVVVDNDYLLSLVHLTLVLVLEYLVETGVVPVPVVPVLVPVVAPDSKDTLLLHQQNKQLVEGMVDDIRDRILEDRET